MILAGFFFVLIRRDLPVAASCRGPEAGASAASVKTGARCLAAGMQGMMSKPVPAALLREALQHGTTTSLPSPPPADSLLDAARLEALADQPERFGCARIR